MPKRLRRRMVQLLPPTCYCECFGIPTSVPTVPSPLQRSPKVRGRQAVPIGKGSSLDLHPFVVLLSWDYGRTCYFEHLKHVFEDLKPNMLVKEGSNSGEKNNHTNLCQGNGTSLLDESSLLQWASPIRHSVPRTAFSEFFRAAKVQA